MEKPIIPIMMCGLSRTFPFGWGQRSEEILNSYLKFFGCLSEKYTLFFYISTDDIHLHDTQTFLNKYGEVRNIHLSNTGYKMNTKVEDTAPIQKYIDNYRSAKLPDNPWDSGLENALYQFHRNLDVCNLCMADRYVYQKAKVMVRMRLDTVFCDDLISEITKYIDEAVVSKQESSFFPSDLIYCGTKELLSYLMKGLEDGLCILDWEEPYDSKAYKALYNLEGLISPLKIPYGSDSYQRWIRSPEGQIVALLHKYVKKIGEENYTYTCSTALAKIIR